MCVSGRGEDDDQGERNGAKVRDMGALVSSGLFDLTSALVRK